MAPMPCISTLFSRLDDAVVDLADISVSPAVTCSRSREFLPESEGGAIINGSFVMPNVKEGNVCLKTYSEVDIQNALFVKQQRNTKYQEQLCNLEGKKASLGPTPYLTSEEELLLVDWIIHCSKKGFPRRKEDIQLTVKSFLDKTPRNTPLRIRVQVFNADETCFNLGPKTSTVLAPRGVKNVYEIEHASSKQNITVLFTFSADGVVTPLLVIFPGKRLKSEIYESVPKEWGIVASETRWMKAHIFVDYIRNVFHPYLVQKVQCPILLLNDGQRTHITYEISVLCRQLGIILICLYPNDSGCYSVICLKYTRRMLCCMDIDGYL
nr:unnamed protein product [Callosobruchus analis]